jgi:branched-chain amino acid transport system permease protein
MPPGAKRYLLIAIAVAVAVSFFSGAFNRYYLGVAIDVAINITLAVSLNLIIGHTGQFSLGHAGFMGLGAYAAATLTWALPVAARSAFLEPLVFALALLVAGGVAAAAGFIVGVPTLRLRGDYLAIVTLGFGEIIRVVLQTTDRLGRNFADAPLGRMFENMGGASGMKGIAALTSFGWAWGVAAITVYAVGALVNSTYGRGFIAVHDDEVAASAMGVNPTRYKVTAFVVGAFFAGLAGGLYAHHKSFLSPSGFDFMKSFEIVVMVILGGMGRTAGVIVAAVVLTLLPELLRGFADYRMIIYSLIIIVLMLTRPQGLFTFGRAPVAKV